MQFKNQVHLTADQAKAFYDMPEDGPFGHKIQQAVLAYLAGSRAAQTAMAENYAGLAY